MNTGKIQMGFPSVGLVGDLRAGLGEPEPAGVRGDLRPSRRPARRSRELERGVHAGGVPGRRVFRSTGDPIVDLKPPAGVSARAAARPARSARQAERDRHAAVSRQLRAGGAHLVVRAGVPDAGVRARGASTSNAESEATRKLYGLDDKITRAVRPAVPDGAPAGRARRAIRAALSTAAWATRIRDTWDAHGDVKDESHAARRGSRPPDRRPADGPEGARAARFDAGASGTASSAACRSRSAASGAITIPGAMTVWMAGAGIKGGQVDRRQRRVRLQGGAAADRRSTICTRRSCTCWASITRS